MEVNKIQLRGISRSPSDRMTSDGGCAESLNMFLHEDESAPVLIPKDITGNLGLPANLQAERIFIHKTLSYENIIVFNSNTNEIVSYINEKPIPICSMLDKNVTFNSIGNTLVIGSESNIQYFIFKDGSYNPLGNKIPFPVIQFKPRYYSKITFSKRETISFHIDETSSSGQESDFWLSHGNYTEQTWNELNKATEKDPIKNPGTQTVNNICKELAKNIYAQAEAEEVFIDPVFVRYAVTLYDGTVTSSIPFLMPGGSENPFLLRYTKKASSVYKALGSGESAPKAELYNASNNESILCKARYPYTIEANLLSDINELENWKDLIKSIDIYICAKEDHNYTDIFATTCERQGVGDYAPNYYHHSSPIEGSFLSEYKHTKYTETYLLLSIGGEEYKKNFITRLLEKSLFYKIESINYRTDKTRLQELKEGTKLNLSSYFNNYDALISKKDILIDDDMLHSDILWSNSRALNNSLLVTGVYEKLGSGAKTTSCPLVDIAAMDNLAKDITPDSIWTYLNPEIVPENYAESIELSFLFTIEENGIEYFVEQKNLEGSNLFKDANFSYYGWILFPHKNCKKVAVYKTGTQYGAEFEMHEHPYLDCSYTYLGLSTNIATHLDIIGDTISIPLESRRITRLNKLYKTTLDNPFIYKKENIYTFQSKVLSTAIATDALSQGQFGKFPLYVFTEDGIWTMQITDDGTFVNPSPLPRHVCINPDSITSIDNAVVFVTDQGVMMLQGAQVVNISPDMNGRHYTIEIVARTIIEGQKDFKDLLPVLSDSTHFMAFVKKASIAYDYAGKRLIFFKEDEAYQYIYKLDTNTWHKMALAGFDLIQPINSYPECLVQGKHKETSKFLVCIDNLSGYPAESILQMVEGYFPYKISTKEFEDFLDGKHNFLVTDISYNSIEEAAIILDGVGVQTTIEVIEDVYTSVYDLSTSLDLSLDQPTANGVIVTRPFDLGHPDVFKTITDIRVRGQYHKGAVKFILLGSNDGFNFYVLNSLRGKSWKLFRLIILADLEPTERISWVDVQYETRFTNRLR